MLNQLVVVGRLVDDPMLYKNDEKDYFELMLAVPRSYKNLDGDYETDFIPCKFWSTLGGTTAEYCHKGDLIGVKGRVESKDSKMYVVAEKVTFLTTKKADE